MRIAACLLACTAVLPGVDVDSSDNLLRLQVAGWWAQPGGDGLDAPASEDLSDSLDASPALLAEAKVDLPIPFLPAVSAGLSLWQNDKDGLDGEAQDAWAALTYGIDVIDYLGFDLGIGAHSAGLTLDGTGVAFDESELIPVGVAEVWVHPIEALDVRVGVHAGAISDSELVAVQGQVTWYLTDLVGIAAGWRWYQATIDTDEAAAEINLNGPYAGLVVTF